MKNTNEPFYLTRAGDAEIPGIIQVLREVRGDTFYAEKTYNAAYLGDSREIAVIAAKTPGGEIAGLIAASKSLFCVERDLLCLLTVRKCLTGLGIASALYANGIGYLHKINASAIKAHMVTDNTVSLHIAEKHGLIPTGLLFNVRDNTKGLPEYALRSDKRTTVVYVKRGIKEIAGTLYLPKRLHGFAGAVYDGFGVMYKLSDRNMSYREHGTMAHKYDSFHSVTYIQIVEYGNDTGQNVSELLTNKEPLHTVTLLLNINSSTAIRAFEALTNMGFRFSGFYPLSADYEYIIMYYGRCVKAAIDEIKTTEKLSCLLNEVLRIE